MTGRDAAVAITASRGPTTEGLSRECFTRRRRANQGWPKPARRPVHPPQRLPLAVRRRRGHSPHPSPTPSPSSASGAWPCRRKPTPEECPLEAGDRVAWSKEERDDDPSATRTVAANARCTRSHLPNRANASCQLYTVFHGMPKSFGTIFHGQPVLRRYNITLTACRMLVVRGAPDVSDGGKNGAINAHCASVRSVS